MHPLAQPRNAAIILSATTDQVRTTCGFTLLPKKEAGVLWAETWMIRDQYNSCGALVIKVLHGMC